MQRRVLVRVDGGPGWGLGHLVRMRWLGAALRARGAEVRYATAGEGARLLREWGHEVALVGADEIAPDGLLGSFTPTHVVVDRLEQGAALCDLRARSRARLVVFDDWGAGLEVADAVVNAIVFHYGRYRRSDVRAALFEGPDHIILAPELAREGVRCAAVLLAFGGNDDTDLAPRVLAALDRGAARLELQVNLGPACRNGDTVRARAAASRCAVTVVEGALWRELPALCVCAGGVMLYEAAFLGVPAAAIAATEDERHNIAYWASRGSALDLGWEHALDEERVAGAVVALAGDVDRRAAMAAAGRAAVDGRGLERCVAIVEG